ncbi:MAG: hypothetical protein Q8908_17085 [Bacteroidota bacterium]|nr:hypothetical protein [Bacteroidota bacterium]
MRFFAESESVIQGLLKNFSAYLISSIAEPPDQIDHVTYREDAGNSGFAGISEPGPDPV